MLLSVCSRSRISRSIRVRTSEREWTFACRGRDVLGESAEGRRLLGCITPETFATRQSQSIPFHEAMP